VELRPERMERLLGERIEPDQAQAILDRLGFSPGAQNGRVTVTVPPWRDSDVQREADLIEEVARIHGLDKLPTTLPARERAVGRLTRSQRLRRRLEDLLRDRGLDECISYSFTSPQALADLRLVPEDPLELENPLSEELSVMRPSLLPGLLDAVRHNAAHGRPDLALFESAHVYHAPGGLAGGADGSPGGAAPAEERHHLAACVTQAVQGGWRSEGRRADFHAARALLEAVGRAAGLKLRAEPAAQPFLHPGRAAAVLADGGRELGWIGELHPLVLRAWELTAAAAFELDVDALVELGAGRVARYSDVTSFPAVLQDIAVAVDEGVAFADVEAAVRIGGGDLLAGLELFDLYHGEQVGEGRKSLALRLEFRAPDRTLTDAEVAERRAAIERELRAIGGQLRA
jgi:phenylalanyl-tRNA synthetase beta chain